MVICFVSGGYALYLTETGVNVVDDSTSSQSAPIQSDIAPHADNSVAGDVAKVASIQDVQTFFENNVNTYSAKAAPTHPIFVEPGFDDTDYNVFNGDYKSFYIHKDLNTTDKYVQCAECGKYIPIGDNSKKLDDSLICTGHEDSCGSYIEDDYCALTYEEVMFTVEHNGYLPESAYTRINEHLGITRPYADYFAGYYGVTPDFEDAPIINTLDYSGNEPVSEDYSANEESMPELVYTYSTYNIG